MSVLFKTFITAIFGLLVFLVLHAVGWKGLGIQALSFPPYEVLALVCMLLVSIGYLIFDLWRDE